MNGYSIPFHKRATPVNFDGSSASKTLFIAGSAYISTINIAASQATDPTTAARFMGHFVLEYFSGAVWTGAAWSGGAWTEFWSGDVAVYWGPTATKEFFHSYRDVTFNPPLRVPGFDISQKNPTTGIYTFPNTHNATEQAGETDVRGYFVTDAGTTTGVVLEATVSVVQ